MRAVVVLSGGMDSTTLLYDVKTKDMKPILLAFCMVKNTPKSLNLQRKPVNF